MAPSAVKEGASAVALFLPYFSSKIDARATFSPPPRHASLRVPFQLPLYDGPHGPDQSA